MLDFLWRMAHNSLPTKVNLFLKRVVDNPLCPLCLQELKIVVQMAWNYCAANDVWATSTLAIHKWLSVMEDIHQLWEKCPPAYCRQMWRQQQLY